MASTRTLARRAALVAAAAVGAVVLTACGSDSMSGMDHGADSPSASASASAPAGAHNDADVAFATEMIQHHRQAVTMAELAADRASSSDVKALAEKIKGAQDPEIETMSGWLTAWGETVPAEPMEGTDHGTTTDMPGMMSTEEMAEMEKASGTAFDTMFLEMMIEHHEGAIEMATTEKEKGEYNPATKLADEIITAQTAEIAEMKKLLG